MKSEMKNEKIWALTRLLTLFITITNSLLAHYGKPVIQTDDAFIYQTISDIAMLISIVWAYWKNNNLTDKAIKAQAFLRKLRRGEVDFEGPEVVTEKSDVEVDNTKEELK
ncbi:phage holin [Macrococcus brunensis]|uniref:phage holin n=1 Tax=Macrococcus brunensis TaxID=198483 RepID=UPI001EF1528F|nr:phage holin [Macrococcus brunensis]ULG70890.1 SPP1 phage holin family protein [Macrococcus brunensis]